VDPAGTDHSDVREALGLVRRHALLIAAVTIATAAAAFAISLTQPSQYTATATVLYTPATTVGGNQPDTATAMQTIQGIGQSTSVLGPIARSYGLGVKELKRDVSLGISVSDTSASQILTIDATSPTAAKSASIANAIAASLIEYRSSRQQSLLSSQIAFLQQELQQLSGKTDPSSISAAADVRTQLVQLRAQQAVFSPDLTVLSPATRPAGASSPHPARNAMIGVFVGFVLGILLSLMRDRLDRRTHNVEEVEAIYHAPTLGRVPFSSRRTSRGDLLADFSGATPLADAYRTIRTNLSLFQLNHAKSSVVLITSAVPAEGKSAVSANLAHALSVTGKRVLAVSADLHNPALHEYFGSPDGLGGTMIPLPVRGDASRGRVQQARPPAGLIQVLAGEMTLEEGARQIPLTPRERSSGGSLALLSNSSTFFDPAALFGSGQMDRFFKLAKQQYDVVVVDAPPLLVNADAALLAQTSDVVVVVARLKLLTRNQARRAVRVMSAAHIAPTGLIVTGDINDPEYGYGYRYGYDSLVTEPTPAEPTPAPTPAGAPRASNTASF
jgi:Mrp family chromosome partitioning ATPase/LPS O-antigen subunit length determinant protein (WzzB/FepE family)